MSVGDLVTYGTEQFYVIGGDTVGTAVSNSTDNIILLAKYNLKKVSDSITLKQDTDVDIISKNVYSNGCAFCSSTAWNDGNVADGDNLNNKTTISSEATSAVGKAIAYGESLGATGRLMLKSEADLLKVSATSSILYGQYEPKYHLKYWLGTAKDNGTDDTNFVWYASGYGSGGTYTYHYTTYQFSGVRPVVEVPKSSIQ